MRASICLGIVLACFGCKGEGGPIAIGPEGGTVSDENGASVEIPAGALSTTVRIVVEDVQSPVDLPAVYLGQGPVYAFTPHGQDFLVPVTVTIPHVANVADAPVVLRLDNELDTSWERVSTVSFSEGAVVFETTSFSYYTVAKVRDPALDILFVIDNSRSMAEEEAALARNLVRFIEIWEGMAVSMPDFHIGVVTTDVGAGSYGIENCTGDGDDGALQNASLGCEGPTDAYISSAKDGAGGRVTNYTGTLSDTFSCIASVGTSGCDFEQPLESMRRALDGSNSANAGFLREHASLAIIIISDEDDCSASNTQLFDDSQDSIDDPLGPLTSFRCFEFGVVCDPDVPRSAGPRQDCDSREDSAYLYPVGGYIDFIRGLKADPGSIIVAGVIGNPTPVTVGTKDQQPTLNSSCTSATADADPGIRLDRFLSGFPNRNTSTTICDDDLSDAFTVLVNLLEKG